MHKYCLSSKSGDKRTYVWAKAKRTCVLLAIGVLSMSSKSGGKRTYVWGKGKKDMCPFRYWRAREGNSECTGKISSKSGDKKKKVICRNASLERARASTDHFFLSLEAQVSLGLLLENHKHIFAFCCVYI